MANLMSITGSVMRQQGEARQFRLPPTSPFPKLDGRGVRLASTTMPSGRAAGSATVLLARGGGALPEMTTDVIDQDANYAVANVKRDRPNGRLCAGVGLGRWLGRLIGGPYVARS